MIPTTAGGESLWGVLSTAPWSWETTNSQAHTHSRLLSKWQRFSHRWRRAGLFQARRGQCGIARDPSETGCVSCRAGRWLQQRCPDTDPSWDHLLGVLLPPWAVERWLGRVCFAKQLSETRPHSGCQWQKGAWSEGAGAVAKHVCHLAVCKLVTLVPCLRFILVPAVAGEKDKSPKNSF